MQWQIKGTNWLDLFAGYGTIGIEAISRGANSVVFVEHHRHVINCLKRNINVIGAEDKCKIIPIDVSVYLEYCKKNYQARLLSTLLVSKPTADNGIKPTSLGPELMPTEATLGNSYDFIYIDPPYKYPCYGQIMENISNSNILGKNGIIIVESSKQNNSILSIIGTLKCYLVKSYGDTKLLLFVNS